METYLLSLFWILLVAAIGTSAVQKYIHLGCYEDHTGSPRLVHQYMTSADEDVSRCLATCQHGGFPFAAVQTGGENCSCGISYDEYRPSDNCVYGCYEEGFPTCGGKTEFSIYYTVMKAHTCPKKSTNVAAFPTDFCLSLTTLPELNFTQARSRCIENGQDLAAIPGESTRERLETLLDSCPLTGKTSVWIGLSRNSRNESLRWSSVLQSPYNQSDYKSNFKSDQSELCIAVDTRSALWEARPCHEKLPFICMTTLIYSSLNPKSAFMRFVDKVIAFYNVPNNAATYLVLPVFVLVMFLCCLPYFCHRMRGRTKHRVVDPETKTTDMEDTTNYMHYSTYFGSFRNKRAMSLY